MNLQMHLRAMRRLRRLGVHGYVVLTGEAGKSGLNTQFPIGQIVGFSDTFSVRVRKVGQSSVARFAAGFWQPAPNRLINHIHD